MLGVHVPGAIEGAKPYGVVKYSERRGRSSSTPSAQAFAPAHDNMADPSARPHNPEAWRHMRMPIWLSR